MAQNSRVGIQINTASVPLFPEASRLAQRGFCPGGLHRNRDFYAPSVKISRAIPEHVQDILFDPQTSGGLLICLAPSKAARLLEKLHPAGIQDAAIIGEVISRPRGKVIVR
jgi:selenide,water dikinase